MPPPSRPVRYVWPPVSRLRKTTLFPAEVSKMLFSMRKMLLRFVLSMLVMLARRMLSIGYMFGASSGLKVSCKAQTARNLVAPGRKGMVMAGVPPSGAGYGVAERTSDGHGENREGAWSSGLPSVGTHRVVITLGGWLRPCPGQLQGERSFCWQPTPHQTRHSCCAARDLSSRATFLDYGACLLHFAAGLFDSATCLHFAAGPLDSATCHHHFAAGLFDPATCRLHFAAGRFDSAAGRHHRAAGLNDCTCRLHSRGFLHDSNGLLNCLVYFRDFSPLLSSSVFRQDCCYRQLPSVYILAPICRSHVRLCGHNLSARSPAGFQTAARVMDRPFSPCATAPVLQSMNICDFRRSTVRNLEPKRGAVQIPRLAAPSRRLAHRRGGLRRRRGFSGRIRLAGWRGTSQRQLLFENLMSTCRPASRGTLDPACASAALVVACRLSPGCLPPRGMPLVIFCVPLPVPGYPYL